MKFSARSAAFLVLLLCSGYLWAGDTKPIAMVDPLMGLTFDPRLVGFEVFPSSEAVTKVVGPNANWIFAAYRNRKTDVSVFIVSGFLEVPAEDHAKTVMEPDFGAVVRVAGKRLEVLGVPDRLFGRRPILPREVVDRLMRDAVDRYIKAFGGRDQLDHEIRSQGIAENDLPPALLERLGERGIRLKRGANNLGVDR